MELPKKVTPLIRREDRVTCTREGCKKLLAVRQPDGSLELKWQTLEATFTPPCTITCPRCGTKVQIEK